MLLNSLAEKGLPHFSCTQEFFSSCAATVPIFPLLCIWWFGYKFFNEGKTSSLEVLYFISPHFIACVCLFPAPLPHPLHSVVYIFLKKPSLGETAAVERISYGSGFSQPLLLTQGKPAPAESFLFWGLHAFPTLAGSLPLQGGSLAQWHNFGQKCSPTFFFFFLQFPSLLSF